MGHRIEPQIPLGEAVKMVREEKALTKTAVAARAGVSARWLRDVEAGKCNPTWANLRRVTVGLQIDLTELAAKVELVEKKSLGLIPNLGP